MNDKTSTAKVRSVAFFALIFLIGASVSLASGSSERSLPPSATATPSEVDELERARKMVEEADRLKVGELSPEKVRCEDLHADLDLICRLMKMGKHDEVIDRCPGVDRMKFRIHAKHECGK
jgi:hypothetical protein